jgi:glycosyltransferase involved in cell wall biosynthesis
MATYGMRATILCTGIVIIGRNEGKRLVACLQSLGHQRKIVYVDSGSTDGSPEQAKMIGAEVVILDMSIPFTAARGRNVGLEYLKSELPSLKYVQFVDGDCVLDTGWLDAAEGFLNDHDDVAVVCGRLRETHPQVSIYNRLCDIEWDTPCGEAARCGGIAMMRVAPVLDVQGFRSDLIAGEEPELCSRLRARGWKVWRLQNDMALHDANILRFSQWWKRMLRSGFGYAALYAMHARSSEKIYYRELVRAIFWGLFLPLVILTLSTQHTSALALFLVYLVQIARIAIRRGASNPISWRYGVFITIAKFAEVVGILKYILSRIMRRETRIIEYK